MNMHEAKTHLSRLVEPAVRGEPFVIAKAGKPLVKVTALDTPSAAPARRLGFMEGQIAASDDFDCMGAEEIEHLFGGGGGSCCWIHTCRHGRRASRNACRQPRAC